MNDCPVCPFQTMTCPPENSLSAGEQCVIIDLMPVNARCNWYRAEDGDETASREPMVERIVRSRVVVR